MLGHSERRQLFGETDGALQSKVPAALQAGLVPILCVGETEEERERGDTERKLRHQVKEGLEKVPVERLPEVVLAYEPIWAIGTGLTATTEQAQEAVAFVRALVQDIDKPAGEAVRILYGGSLKPGNARELLGLSDVDGALAAAPAPTPGRSRTSSRSRPGSPAPRRDAVPPMAAPRRSVCVRRDTIVHVVPIVARAAEHAPGIAVVSHAGGMTFGVCADRATVPDLDVLTDGIVTSPHEPALLAHATSAAR